MGARQQSHNGRYMVEIVINDSPKSPNTKQPPPSEVNPKTSNDIINRMGKTALGATKGIMGLRFLHRTATGKEDDAWKALDKRFDVPYVDGVLYRDNFGLSIGMSNSKEFASKQFDALARRRNVCLPRSMHLNCKHGVSKPSSQPHHLGLPLCLIATLSWTTSLSCLAFTLTGDDNHR